MARRQKKSQANKAPKKRPGPPPDLAQEAFSRVEAADAACLVGEMHLKNGDYKKAVQAFTQAIENNPTPDAYQGRAQAYHALADKDERNAQGQTPT